MSDEYEKRIIDEQCKWLDGFAKEHGWEAAAQQAEANRNSLGSWGAVWLEKNAPPPAVLEKAAEQGYGKALADFNAAQAAYEKAHQLAPGTGVNKFVQTAEGRELLGRYTTARAEVSLRKRHGNNPF